MEDIESLMACVNQHVLLICLEPKGKEIYMDQHIYYSHE